MDAVMEARRQMGSTPFDGACLYCEDLLPVSQLRLVLLGLVDLLKATTRGELLFAFDDWHEHDGFVTTTSATTWSAIEATLATDESLYAARLGDTHVHRALYPQSFAYLLRFYVLDEDEERGYPGVWGKCDLSSSSELVSKARLLMPASNSQLLRVAPARQFFDRNYAG